MARQCSVCARPEREKIDREFARRGGSAKLESQYGLTRSALRNHRERHLGYLLDPALGLEASDLAAMTIMRTTTRRIVHKGD